MDARVARAAFLAAVLLSTCMGASYRTQNFIVSAPNQSLAQEVCEGAEAFRRDLANEWLGAELPNWEQPCPIVVQVAPNLGAGGATSFVFHGGRPHDFRMNIQGSRERVLDSVLPHEVLHTIFASHYGRPLPRWADEGACTTVEHESEKGKQHRMLYEFLTTQRGIAFHQMFAMKEYPRDILPLYAQGYSLARFFIEQGGKRKYVAYVGEGMDTNNWTETTRKYYGQKSLADLQTNWLAWVRKGSPKLDLVNEGLVEPNLAATPGSIGSVGTSRDGIAHLNTPKGSMSSGLSPTAQGVASLSAALQQPAPPKETHPNVPQAMNPRAALPGFHGLASVEAAGAPNGGSPNGGSPNGGSWYSRSSQSVGPNGEGLRTAALPPATTNPPIAPANYQEPIANPLANNPPPPAPPAPTAPPVDQALSRPQTPQQPRQIILEWTRLPQGGQPR